MNEIESRLKRAESFGEIFTLVKRCVYENIGRRRAGLMLGLYPLGFSPRGFIGAYHQLDSNLIVINESLINKISKERPKMLNYYVFHLLMHEYLHSLGIVDEEVTRLLTEKIAEQTFGPSHILTKIARRFEAYLPNIKYPESNSLSLESTYITLIEGFEKEDTSYIG